MRQFFDQTPWSLIITLFEYSPCPILRPTITDSRAVWPARPVTDPAVHRPEMFAQVAWGQIWNFGLNQKVQNYLVNCHQYLEKFPLFPNKVPVQMDLLSENFSMTTLVLAFQPPKRFWTMKARNKFDLILQAQSLIQRIKKLFPC